MYDCINYYFKTLPILKIYKQFSFKNNLTQL